MPFRIISDAVSNAFFLQAYLLVEALKNYFMVTVIVSDLIDAPAPSVILQYS